MTSILSAFPFIGEQSFATPGAFNSPLSIISANLAAINTSVGAVSGVTISPPSGNTIQIPSDLSISGYLSVGKGVSIGTTAPSIAEPVAVTIGVNSGISDYLYFNDTSNLRSDYLVGSHAGGTADGLNIFDVSGNTLIVGFSKQSVRFYVPVVASAFDTGSRVYDLRAYGGDPTGATASDIAFAAAKAAAPAGLGTTLYLSAGTWKFLQTLDLTTQQPTTLHLIGDSPQLTVILSSVSTTAGIIASSVSNQYNAVKDLTLFHSDLLLPSKRTGNYGIRNLEQVAAGFIIENVQIRYFGDSGIYIEGPTAPTVIRDAEIQRCQGYGIDVELFNGNPSQDIEITGGDLQNLPGGIKINGGQSITIIDADIELGAFAMYPCINLLNAANANHLVNCSLSQITTSTTTPQGIVSIANSQGNIIEGGLNTTNSAGSADNIYLDVGASANLFIGGRYSNTTTASGFFVNMQQTGNIPVDNVFIHPNVVHATYQAGKNIINGDAPNDYMAFGQLTFGSSSSTYGIAYQHTTNPRVLITGNPGFGNDVGSIHLGSIGLRPQRALTITGYIPANAVSLDFVGGRVIVNEGGNAPREAQRWTPFSQSLFTAGSVLLPAIGFSSETSLGLYRSGISTVAFSFGTVNLATNSVRLSMRTAASLDSTTLAVNEVAFSIQPGSSGASLAIRSGGTIFYFASSNSTKAP